MISVTSRLGGLLPCLSASLCLCGFFPSGCSVAGLPEGKPVSDAYHGGRTDTLSVSEAASPFAAKQPVPILSAPEVFAIYVPARLDRKRDVLVGEHWIFLKLRDAEWFTERDAEPDPPAGETAGGPDLAPLGEIPLEETLVPWRGAK